MSVTEQAAHDAVTTLTSWRDGAAKQAITSFVEKARALPPEERVAVFDNDGTLWCEQPMPIQLDFILRRMGEIAVAQPELRERHAWKAVCRGDFGWLGSVMAEHYTGDDSNVGALAQGILQPFAGFSVEEF